MASPQEHSIEHYQRTHEEQPGLIPGSPPPQPHNSYEPKTNQFVFSPAPSQGTVPYPYSQTGYAPSNTYTDSRPRDHTILGLRAATFWLLLALIIVIIAAAVGGGVGGSIAVNNAKTSCLVNNGCPAAAGQSTGSSSVSSTANPTTSSVMTTTSSTASSTSTSTSSATETKTTVWGPLATTLPYSGCPGNNNTIYTSVTGGSRYQIVCGLDIPYTAKSDLIAAIVPTFQLCMEMCSSWNDIGRSNGNATTKCKGIAFIPSHVNGDGGGSPIDCVLKSYAAGLIVNPSYVVDSAILLDGTS